jgi:hypothetical protein
MKRVSRLRALVGVWVCMLSASGAGLLRAQDARDSLIAQARVEFDPVKRTRLLISALDPRNGPPRGTFAAGVQLLAQTLIEGGRDSTAALWLRWAIRLQPTLEPDTIQFPPQVTSAVQAAHRFVNQTRGAGDSLTSATWVWPAEGNDQRPSHVLVGSSGAIPLRVFVDGTGPLTAGDSTTVMPGSHGIRALAAGYDSVTVTREVPPASTLILHFGLHALASPLQARMPGPPAPPVVGPRSRKHFPWVLAALGAAGAGTAVVLLTGKSNPPRTGSLTVSFP